MITWAVFLPVYFIKPYQNEICLCGINTINKNMMMIIIIMMMMMMMKTSAVFLPAYYIKPYQNLFFIIHKLKKKYS
jgi:hypothetical protein